MLAVIKTGGKQYLVKPGDKIEIEKIEKNEGEEIIFEEILLSEKDGKLEIGSPFIKGVQVFGKILKQGKGDKDIIFRYKAKTRRRTKRGHRQLFTEVEITKIGD